MMAVAARRGRRALAGLVVVAAVGAAVVGLPAQGASAAEPPAGTTRIPLGVYEARALAVDDGTGRVFVAAEDEVLARASDGSALATIEDLPGASELETGLGAVWVLAADSSSIARIDPTTLAVTDTWMVDEATDLSGLALADGRLWTSGVVGDDVVLVDVDPATDEVGTHPTPEGTDPLVLAGSPAAPDILVAAEVGYVASAFVFDISGATVEVQATRAVDYFYVSDLAISSDGDVVTIAAGVATDYSTADLAPVSDVGYYTPPTLSVAVDRREVVGADDVVVSAGIEEFLQPTVAVFRAGQESTDFRRTGGLVGTGLYPSGGVRLSPDHEQLYVLDVDEFFSTEPHQIEAELRIIDLVPEAEVIAPRVVGPQGGGVVTVNGTELATATATIGGQDPTSEDGASSQRRFVTPALPAGEAPVVLSRFGVDVTLDTPVVVRDLGPFRDSTDFVDQQEDDFYGGVDLGRLGAVDAALAAGGSLGTLPAELVRESPAATHRSPVIRLYQAMFLRPPDLAGLRFWEGRLDAGRSLTWVASAMAASAEFRNRYGALSDAAFVDEVYERAGPTGRARRPAVLDRRPGLGPVAGQGRAALLQLGREPGQGRGPGRRHQPVHRHAGAGADLHGAGRRARGGADHVAGCLRRRDHHLGGVRRPDRRPGLSPAGGATATVQLPFL